MPQPFTYDQPINKLHRNILNEFGTVAFCAKKLGYKTRKSIYDMINHGVSDVQYDRLKACGYTAEFKRI